MDFLPVRVNGRTTGYSMHAGGAPFNVAVGLARLGAPVSFAGKLSTDMFGHYLRSRVQEEGISGRFLSEADAPATLAFVDVEGGEPAFAFYREGTADTSLTLNDLPSDFFAETTVLHFGSISLLRGSTPQTVLSAAERLKGSALLSFDPNIRPAHVRQGDEATYRVLLQNLVELTDVIKTSASDLAWLMPGRRTEEALEHLSAAGSILAAATLGDAGVLARRGKETWRVPAFPVAVVDTVGAGDAFTAGLLAALADSGVSSRDALKEVSRASIVHALSFASAVAALTCTRVGADPPTRGEVEAFLGHNGVNEIQKGSRQG